VSALDDARRALTEALALEAAVRQAVAQGSINARAVDVVQDDVRLRWAEYEEAKRR